LVRVSVGANLKRSGKAEGTNQASRAGVVGWHTLFLDKYHDWSRRTIFSGPGSRAVKGIFGVIIVFGCPNENWRRSGLPRKIRISNFKTINLDSDTRSIWTRTCGQGKTLRLCVDVL
jgi:hypothetical protein